MRKSVFKLDQIDALLSGKGMAFLGRFNTAGEITNPVEGGHYLVGTTSPYDVYTYINGELVNGGKFQGEKGDPFTFEDFTPEQLESLKGPKGDKGNAFTFADFTEAQLESLRGPQGVSVVSVVKTAGTGAPGTVDTYTITLSNGSTSEFTVYNGADGEGAGDMLSAVYDPNGKRTDAFGYAETKASDAVRGHNSDTTAHPDIRTLVSNAQTAATNAGSAAARAQSSADNAQNVADALSRFQNGLGNEYVWDKCTPNFTYTEKSITNGDQNSLVFTGSGSSAKFRISNTLQDALLGVYTEQTVTPANRTSLNGKYVRTDAVQYSNQPSAYEYIFYINPSATWSIYTNPNGYCFSTGTVYRDIEPAHIHQEYVNSADPNAYPANAVSASDGFAYKLLGQLGGALARAKIATGSYTGTGTYGSGKENSLTFNFEPKFVFITAYSNSYSNVIQAMLARGQGRVVYSSVSNNNAISYSNKTTLSWNENTVSWYSTDSADSQLNTSGYTYHYLAIG